MYLVRRKFLENRLSALGRELGVRAVRVYKDGRVWIRIDGHTWDYQSYTVAHQDIAQMRSEFLQ